MNAKKNVRDKLDRLGFSHERGGVHTARTMMLADTADAPWYELGLQYGGKLGDRINDHHLTLAEKRAARAKKGKA